MSDLDDLGKKHTLIESIKNGPVQSSECLLIVNGHTIRLGLQGVSVTDQFDYVAPRVQIDAVIFSDPRALSEAIYGLRENK